MTNDEALARAEATIRAFDPTSVDVNVGCRGALVGHRQSVFDANHAWECEHVHADPIAATACARAALMLVAWSHRPAVAAAAREAAA